MKRARLVSGSVMWFFGFGWWIISIISPAHAIAETYQQCVDRCEKNYSMGMARSQCRTNCLEDAKIKQEGEADAKRDIKNIMDKVVRDQAKQQECYEKCMKDSIAKIGEDAHFDSVLNKKTTPEFQRCQSECDKIGK